VVNFFIPQTAHAMVGRTALNMFHFEMVLVTQPRLEMITARVVITARGRSNGRGSCPRIGFKGAAFLSAVGKRDTGKKPVGVRVFAAR
jgi:hypothetical protein